MTDTAIKGPLAFTASDDTGLETYDAAFVELSTSGPGYVGIKSNALTMLFSDPGVDHAYRDSSSYGADQYVTGTLGGSFGVTNAQILWLCRASADTGANRDYYVLRLADGAGGAQTTSVERWNNNALTTLDTRTSVAWAAGDAPKLRAITNGANCDLVVIKNGSTLYTISDTSPLSDGKPGIGFRMPSGNVASVDGLELGDVTAPAPPIITGPTGAAGAVSIAINVAESTTTIGTWTATDSGTWSISGGADAAQVQISVGGAVTFTALNDFENPDDDGANRVYNFTVQNVGPGGTTTQDVAVTITDVNEAPTFSGTVSVPPLTQNVAMTAITVTSLFADVDASDTATYSPIGSWPTGVTVSSAGVISGTPTVSGTYSNLQVRRTDSGSLFVNSNTFSIAVTAATYSVTTTPLENLSGSLLLSIAMNYSWFPGGRIGSLVGITPQEGSATTNATTGILTVSGLTASGTGLLISTIRGTTIATDTVHYHQLVAA